MDTQNLFYQAGGLTPAQQAALATKWAYLNKGITNPKDRMLGRKTHMGKLDPQLLEAKRRGVDYICENVQAQLMRDGLLHETTNSTLATAVGSFPQVAMPLVRAALPRLILWDLVPVMPISQPGGKVFSIDFLRSSDTSLAAKASFSTSYAEASEGATVPSVNAAISEASIQMYTKKLRAVITAEAEQNLRAYYGLDARQELLGVQADEIAREIDYKCLALLVAGAGAGNVPFTTTAPSELDEINMRAYKRRLYDALIDAQNLVFGKVFRKPNWAISGIDEMAHFEKLEDFKLSPEASDADHSVGRHYLGTISRRSDVYVDPWWTDTGKILVGYKGQSWFDTGAVYSPFLGVYQTPQLTDPNDMTTRFGLMTRFGFTIIKSNFYATITLSASAQ